MAHARRVALLGCTSVYSTPWTSTSGYETAFCARGIGEGEVVVAKVARADSTEQLELPLVNGHVAFDPSIYARYAIEKRVSNGSSTTVEVSLGTP